MGNLGFQELLVILLVAFFVVGPKRLPEIGRALGEAIRAFQESLKQGMNPHDDDKPSPPSDST